MYQSLVLLRGLFKMDKETIEIEPFNQAYESCTFVYGRETYRSRIVHRTPKKKGYFTALWTKRDNGTNRPFRDSETCDYTIIMINDGAHQGYFRFPKQIMIHKGISSSSAHKGKMAFRVYPPWEDELNATAARSQSWQLRYFRKINNMNITF
ncbi:MepB family protein [Staphylococcus massiliensis]|uniref:MepB family protein n=1 Tax=Staphylococcus massiliensis TaxID=555791 RepID=UPI001EE0414E|nr:MepB family protein [Staphylococcus massiliensis]MCG3402142.1 MepB family protein [Staphylococcus massiliensis]